MHSGLLLFQRVVQVYRQNSEKQVFGEVADCREGGSEGGKKKRASALLEAKEGLVRQDVFIEEFGLLGPGSWGMVHDLLLSLIPLSHQRLAWDTLQK